MADIATLGLRVDSREVRSADRDLDRFTRTGARVQRATTQMERGMQGVNRSARVMAAGVASAVAAFAGLGAAGRASQQFMQMNNSLRALGMSSAEAASRLNEVAEIATRTRSPLQATAQLYQRITIAGRDLGASQQQVARFTENVTLALAQTGTSAQEASGALLQLSQAMASGIVRAEEFNSILEGAFPIAQAAANAIDGAAGSVGRLRQMIVEGEVTSRQFFEAILSQSGALEAAFANTEATVGQAMNVLSTGLTMLFGQLDQASGASTALASAILALGQSALRGAQLVSENMDAIATGFERALFYAGSFAALMAGRYVVGLAAAAAATFTLSGALVALRVALIRTGIGALVVGAGELAFRFSNLVQAVGGVGEAFNLLGRTAVAVFQGIITSAGAIVPALAAVFNQVRASFLGVLQDMAGAWARFLTAIGAGLVNLGLIDNVLGQVAERAWIQFDRLTEAVDGANAAASDLATTAREQVSEGLGQASDALGELRSTVTEFGEGAEDGADAADALVEALGGMETAAAGRGGGGGGAAGAVEELADEMQRMTTFSDGFRSALQGATMSAVELGQEMGSTVVQGITGVTDAFGQFLTGGFESFQDFARAILRSFQQMLAQMISMALRNRIMIGLGFSAGGGAAGAAQAATGGGGGLLGGIGNLFGGAANFAGTGKTGFMGGLSNALGGGGLFNIGANASLAGGGIVATLGAIAPLAIGGIAIAALAGLFGGREKTDVGSTIEVRFRDGVPIVNGTERFEEAPGIFGGGGEFNRLVAASEDQVSAVENAYASIRESVNDLAERIAINTEGLGLWEGYSFNIDTWEKSAEEIEAAIIGRVEQMTQDYAKVVLQSVDAYDKVVREGEGAADALQRIVTSLSAVNAHLTFFRKELFDISIEGAVAAAQLEDFFGGPDAMAQGLQTYFENFFSLEEQYSMRMDRLGLMLESIGINTVPKTVAAFRDLVESQDLSTEAGRRAYAGLVNLAGEFFDLRQIAGDLGIGGAVVDLEALARAVRETEQALTRAVNAERNRLNQLITGYRQEIIQQQQLAQEARTALGLVQLTPFQQAQAAAANYNETLSTLSSAIGEERSRLEDEIGRLRDDLFPDEDAPGLEARDMLSDALSLAEQLADAARDVLRQQERIVEIQRRAALSELRGMLASGRIDEGRVPDLIESASSFGDTFATRAERDRELFGTARVLQDMADLATTQGERMQARENRRAAEARKTALDQLSALEKQLTELEQIEKRFGIFEEKLTIDELIAEAMKARDQADRMQQISDAFYTAQLEAAEWQIQHLETQIGLAEQELERLDSILEQFGLLNEGVLSVSEAVESLQGVLRRQAEAAVPAFASGGHHRGGLRIVGERGPELEATGPARYYSAPETRAMIGTDPALAKEMQITREYLQQMVKIGHRQERRLRNIESQNEMLIDQGAA